MLTQSSCEFNFVRRFSLANLLITVQMYGVNLSMKLAPKSPVNFRNLSDETLHQNTINLAHHERQTTLEILHHLREVERRSLFALRAYSSLFEYVVSELKYSIGAAHR